MMCLFIISFLFHLKFHESSEADISKTTKTFGALNVGVGGKEGRELAACLPDTVDAAVQPRSFRCSPPR